MYTVTSNFPTSSVLRECPIIRQRYSCHRSCLRGRASDASGAISICILDSPLQFSSVQFHLLELAYPRGFTWFVNAAPPAVSPFANAPVGANHACSACTNDLLLERIVSACRVTRYGDLQLWLIAHCSAVLVVRASASTGPSLRQAWLGSRLNQTPIASKKKLREIPASTAVQRPRRSL